MDAVVLEIGEDLNDPFKAMKLMQLEGDRTIFDFFNEEQTDSILAWVEGNMGMNREKFTAAFGKMKPFILVSLGSEMDMAKSAESYEKTIMKIQKESKIKLEGLETIEEQMRAIRSALMCLGSTDWIRFCTVSDISVSFSVRRWGAASTAVSSATETSCLGCGFFLAMIYSSKFCSLISCVLELTATTAESYFYSFLSFV